MCQVSFIEPLNICWNVKHVDVFKAVDRWVLGGAEALPHFWHFYVKSI